MKRSILAVSVVALGLSVAGMAGAQTVSTTVSSTVTVATTTTLSPTSTPIVMPMHQAVNVPSMLQINPEGRFLARGLVVQSVGSGTFTGTVWGLTYTVNLSAAPVGGDNGGEGDMMPEFLLRDGRGGGQFNAAQIQVGDELGVSGVVLSASPMVVNAAVVRNYSISTPRPLEDNNGNGEMMGGGRPPMMGSGDNGFSGAPGIMMGGNVSGTVSGTLPMPPQGRLEDLMRQLQQLQQQFHGMMGGQGGGQGPQQPSQDQ